MSILSDGNVGIGTTLVSSALAVQGGLTVGTYSSTAAPANSLIVSGSVGIGTTLAASKLAVQGSLTVGTYSGTAAPANSLIVSGSVGIGTTLAASALAVQGGLTVGTYSDTTAPTNSLIVSGNVGIGTTNPSGLLALGAGGASFAAPSGSAPLYACRAWVNFDGTTAGVDPASMTIRGNGNVSSVTRTGTGIYQVYFTNNLIDANYGVTNGGSDTNAGANNLRGMTRSWGFTTSNFSVNTISNSSAYFSHAIVCLSVFR